MKAASDSGQRVRRAAVPIGDWLLRLLLLAALGVLLRATPVWAEAGVTDGAVTIGMSVPLSGAGAPFGSALRQGVETCFRQVNDNGGIHGRMLRLMVLDDGGDPGRALANTKKMIGNGSVLALTSYFGAAPAEAVLPLLKESGTPLIGVASGAESLRDPPQRYVFNLRASYHDETDAIILQLDSQRLNRVAILYQNDALGRAALDSARKTMLNLAITPTTVASIDSTWRDTGRAATEIAAGNPQAVLMIAPAGAVVEFMQRVQALGAFPQFIALSMLTDDPLILKQGRGLAISQGIPYPRSASLPVALQYMTLTKQRHDATSYYGFEGFLAAKLTAEAIRRAGKNPTREKLLSALEGEYDLDGFEIRFAPSGLYSRSGSRRVEMSVVGRDGNTVR